MSTQLREGSTEPNSDGTNILQQHIFYKNEDSKKCQFINIGISIPIVTWKPTNNRSHIISKRFFSSYSFYYENNQRSKLDVESSSIPVNHIELFYRLTVRLLFTSKITRLDVLDFVTYVLTMIELPTNYCKNRNLKKVYCSQRKHKRLYCPI